MEELLEILEGIAPGEDFENCTTLIDDHIPLRFYHLYQRSRIPLM